MSTELGGSHPLGRQRDLMGSWQEDRWTCWETPSHKVPVGVLHTNGPIHCGRKWGEKTLEKLLSSAASSTDLNIGPAGKISVKVSAPVSQSGAMKGGLGAKVFNLNE